MEAVECGAAALGSVLGYFGRIVPLEELREECGVSRDGVTAKNVVRAARKYGLGAQGFKKETTQLPELPLPAILFWNFNHFVVLEGFSGNRKRVFLNDPGTGPRQVTWQQLDEAFTGVVLTFRKTPEFRPGGREPSLIQAVPERIRGAEAAITFLALSGLALVVPGFALPVFARVFVDQVLVGGLQSWLAPLLIGLALTAVVRTAITALQERYLLRLETRLGVTGAGTFVWHVLRLPVGFFAQRYAGDVAGRVGMNQQIASIMSGRLATTAVDLVVIAFYGVLMLMYDVGLTVVAVLAAVFNLLIVRWLGRARVDANRRLLQEEAKFSGALMSGLQNMETVKATSREPELFASLSGHMANVTTTAQELDARTTFFNVLPEVLEALVVAVVLVWGAQKVMLGEMTMGMLVAFQSLNASFMGPVAALVGLTSEIQDLQVQMNRVDDVLRYPADPRAGVADVPGDAQAARMPARKLSGRVQLKGVTFGYSRLAPPLISDFNLELEPGSRVALVGSSGSGKSTVSKLVCQLYQPWEGEVLFDGVPARDIPRPVLTSSLAFVDQDLVLFEGTIRDNLTLWDSTAPDQDVVRAAKDALIHEAIVARPSGYDAFVNEGGGNFSGGQRQRLDIARALAGDPRILVLDEATSALDPLTERTIDENLRARGCTCIIVAHRLSTIRDCDEIIVMEYGRVVQRGTHPELMQQAGGLYQRLIEA
jgi:NHLM bacteriocin system ABC transporter peptidase/ATP-binding protein